MASAASAAASATRRQFDLLVYGATGFTGRLVAAYLAEHAPAGLRWGIAGRSAERLAAVKAELAAAHPSAASIGVVVGEGATAGDVAKATRAVVSTAGPYLLYGEPLVKACAEAGTHYADLTGACAGCA